LEKLFTENQKPETHSRKISSSFCLWLRTGNIPALIKTANDPFNGTCEGPEINQLLINGMHSVAEYATLKICRLFE